MGGGGGGWEAVEGPATGLGGGGNDGHTLEDNNCEIAEDGVNGGTSLAWFVARGGARGGWSVRVFCVCLAYAAL